MNPLTLLLLALILVLLDVPGWVSVVLVLAALLFWLRDGAEWAGDPESPPKFRDRCGR